MKTVTALIHREFLEHRGAFLYAPAILLILLTLIMASGLGFNRWRPQLAIDSPATLKFFEMGFLGLAGLWFVYLLFALFFYFADAFNADRRNNSMLFWKSLPVSDFTVLGSKMLAGLTIFPALIFAVILLSGVIIYGFSAAASVFAIQGLVVPGVTAFVASAGQIAILAFVYIGLGLLWYAPFFAWVGLLSTVVGRWSIPLAFLIPGLAVLAENLIFRGIGQIIGDFFMGTVGPRGGYVLSYLRERASFGNADHALFQEWFTRPDAIEAGPLIASLISGIDWGQMVIGIAAAAVLVFLASEYRRRFIVG